MHLKENACKQHKCCTAENHHFCRRKVRVVVFDEDPEGNDGEHDQCKNRQNGGGSSLDMDVHDNIENIFGHYRFLPFLFDL